MVNQTKVMYHQPIRKRIHQKHEEYQNKDRLNRFYDKFIYFVVIIAPIANIPQLLKVWIEKDASGVSSLSWFFFSGISISWFIYGILHKDKPILLMNAALMVIQVLIAIGAIVYG